MDTTSIILPELYLITPEPSGSSSNDLYLKNLKNCLKNGIRLVQFRAKTITDAEYFMLAEKIAKLCEEYGALLLLNSTYQPKLGGMHLTSTQLMFLTTRPKMYGLLLAASCHHLGQIEKANEIGVDFIVLSPIKETSSHPGSDVLGWSEAKRLSLAANMPVYALGGMSLNDLDEAGRRGMQGIAAISSLWNR